MIIKSVLLVFGWFLMQLCLRTIYKMMVLRPIYEIKESRTFNPIQDGGAKSAPISLSTVTSTNVGIIP